ncbi:hypothetical protein E34_2163 [Lactococcus lactis subsp. lactis]|nr:hypothetical protein E34_2163 [Lactococcus lactis subsp. lactis]
MRILISGYVERHLEIDFKQKDVFLKFEKVIFRELEQP